MWRNLTITAIAWSTFSILSLPSVLADEDPPPPSLPEAAVSQASRTLDPLWVKSMKWRSIGPTSMGGRIIDLEVIDDNPSTFYAATASGGLFKTENYGVTFEAQFQFENTIAIGDACVSPSNPDVVWIGTGEHNARNSVSWGDGVYKSTDGGKSWTHMGLDESFQIGRIAIHPTDPDIVYVGALGRLWGANEQRGLYKTIDGGRSWEKILYVDDMTGCIEVALCPVDPNTILAAMYERRRDPFDGANPIKRWGPGSGLFKSTDGGRSWRRVQQGLPNVPLGRIGVSYYRANPDHVYAVVESQEIGTAPEGSQLPAFMGIQGTDRDNAAALTSVTEGGPAAKAGLKVGDLVLSIGDVEVGAYRELSEQIREHHAGDTVTIRYRRDNEESETELTFGKRGGDNDRPFGTRLGGQVHNIEGQQGPDGFQTGGIFKSTDGGESWERINSLNPRPFYYSQIRVDPSDENYIYVLGISLYRSSDGGKTFSNDAGRGVHSDHHAMWIDPTNGKHIILGCDGGLNITHSRTEQWEFLSNLAIGQFYHIGVDTRTPYRIYGGMQDNGSWGGPSAMRGSTGPTVGEWYAVGGGDGFVCLIDPENPDIVYYESQYGAMSRVDLATGDRNRIRPPREEGKSYRFNWKTPFLLSHHNPRIYYCAGNYVFRSLNRGENLQRISPEVTTHKLGTSTALAESPLDSNVLYVGTDDGNLWGTKNGGHDWSKLEIADLPGTGRYSSIETSRYQAGRAYLTVDRHYYDDDTPYVFVTEDFGETWNALHDKLPTGSARVLREDIENENVLYLGTEFAIWISVDRGQDWTRLNNNLPNVAIHEIAIHPTAGEIVAGTHGRSLWIMDIAPLRQISEDVMKADVHLFQPAAAIEWHGFTGKRFYGQKHFLGENPDFGAPIYYSLREKARRVRLTILDEDNRVIRELRAPSGPGLHRVLWDLRQLVRRNAQGSGRGSAQARFFNRSGQRVQPGTFRVRLTVDGETFTEKLTVLRDPDFPADSLTYDEDEAIRKLEKVLDD